MPQNTSQLDRFALAIAGGASIVDAAKEAGVSERTAYRWAGDAATKAKVTAARDELFSRAVSVLAGTATEAAETLKRLLGSKSEKIQLQAARLALELGASLRDHAEIAARLAAIEQRDEERERAHDDRPFDVVPRRGAAS